ncbi:dihydroorotase, homodimeric type [Phytophthora cinnamomi]|uniref:dihydroorotase, homodimeric type n=1 Tax=Phytophthora cinnamomi TaxID=4785 RepID=UPI003559CAFD|nr:dihydroorotase, homodimeric type [Phytophthora cinnamomi]
MARTHKTALIKQRMADEAREEQEAREAEEARRESTRAARTRSEKAQAMKKAAEERNAGGPNVPQSSSTSNASEDEGMQDEDGSAEADEEERGEDEEEERAEDDEEDRNDDKSDVEERKRVHEHERAGRGQCAPQAICSTKAKWVSARPDDLHHHLREGDAALARTVSHATSQFARCIVMPNLVPPVTTTGAKGGVKGCEPLVTFYMTDGTTADEIRRAAATNKIFVVKPYHAGATANPDSGVTKINNIYLALEAMSEFGMPQLVHNEVTDPSANLFDRAATFVEQLIKPLMAKFPPLKVVVENMTIKEDTDFVTNAPANIAATITPQCRCSSTACWYSSARHTVRLPCMPLPAAAKSLPRNGQRAPRLAKGVSCGRAGIYSVHAVPEL